MEMGWKHHGTGPWQMYPQIASIGNAGHRKTLWSEDLNKMFARYRPQNERTAWVTTSCQGINPMQQCIRLTVEKLRTPNPKSYVNKNKRIRV